MPNIIHKAPNNNNTLESIGQKVKTGAEIAGGVKTIFDIGKSIWNATKVALPVAEATLLALA